LIHDPFVKNGGLKRRYFCGEMEGIKREMDGVVREKGIKNVEVLMREASFKSKNGPEKVKIEPEVNQFEEGKSSLHFQKKDGKIRLVDFLTRVDKRNSVSLEIEEMRQSCVS
jgi:hypothetical protein